MLLTITSWWQSMEIFEKTFWFITFLFSMLFVVQTIISFIGGDDGSSSGHADISVDNDHGVDQQYFTIKNFITFFTIFGWVGIAGIKGNLPTFQVILFALISGMVVVALMVFLFARMTQLRASGTLDIRNAMHQPAETYLSIPAMRGGYGKVHIRIQGSLHEMRALTDDKEDITTGTPVRVIGIINESVLLVTAKH